MQTKSVTYMIEKVAGVEGFYLDVYAGNKRITSKVYSDADSLSEGIKGLERQLIKLGFTKKGE